MTDLRSIASLDRLDELIDFLLQLLEDPRNMGPIKAHARRLLLQCASLPE